MVTVTYNDNRRNTRKNIALTEHVQILDGEFKQVHRLINWRRSVRAQLRKAFGYTTQQLDALNDRELTEAWNDYLYVKDK